MSKIPLIVICGPTASGKTALSIAIANALNGEIVSCDSMQIYKGMDIATAKPTVDERAKAVHHLVDFLDPGESFSVAEYIKLANSAITDIHSRGRTPILCGGTGLYVTSLVDNVTFDEFGSDESIRQELFALANQHGNGYLLDILREFDPDSAERLHENNLNRIIRAIEVYRVTGKTITDYNRNSKLTESPYDTVMIGINYRDRQKLYDRINLRVDLMLNEGLLKEAKEVLSNEQMKTAAQAIGYKELAPYFSGERTLEDCIENLKMQSRRYAKRQLTWLRRDQRIRWIYADECESFDDILNQALEYIKDHY